MLKIIGKEIFTVLRCFFCLSKPVYSVSLLLPSTGPEVIKLNSCTTQLSTKFILLINVKMPTIVGILTFISMINTTSETLQARNLLLYLSIF